MTSCSAINRNPFKRRTALALVAVGALIAAAGSVIAAAGVLIAAAGAVISAAGAAQEAEVRRITLDDLPPAVSDAELQVATWASPPNQFGPDLPPVGRSLFDRLFGDASAAGGYRIPFPLSDLVKRLAAEMTAPDAGQLALSGVLIPMGRSLQRDAAIPEQFRYPRVVIATDREPARGAADTPWLLRDRLFLGYQEKTNVLEVISYNQDAARFEFQVVRDYGPGTTANVYYARRSLCMSCHQNGAPIFANAPWDETNANRAVVGRLQNERNAFYGFPVNQAGSGANAIDRAANRASLLPVFQRIWRQGCGADRAAAAPCRTAMFTAMLQFRLSESTHFDNAVTSFRDDLVAVLQRSWQRHWPNGLLISAANIPDRNPFREHAAIDPFFDPLSPRPPAALWRGNDPRPLRQVIKEFALDIPASDVQRLDTHLRQNAGVASTTYRAHCDLEAINSRSPGFAGNLSCTKDPISGLGIAGKLSLTDGAQVAGHLDWLDLPGSITFSKLRFSPTAVSLQAGRATASISLRHNNSVLRARLPSGDAVERLELSWDPRAAGLATRRGSIELSAKLTVRHDFAPVGTALSKLLVATVAGDSAIFGNRPFDSLQTVRALFAELGMQKSSCCDDSVALNPPRLEPEPTFAGSDDGSPVTLLRRYCGACHSGDARFPPGFLSGQSAQVQTRIERCAPRMFYRLSMWNRPPQLRRKSPMPPLAPTPNPPAWPNHGHYLTLLKYLGELAGVTVDQAGAVATGDYERLPGCALATN